MDDDEIIYIALSNNILAYTQLIEEDKATKEALQLAEYIITRSLELLDTYGAKIKKEDTETPIQKPKWR